MIHCPAGWIEADTDLFREVYAELAADGHSAYDDYLRQLGLEKLREDSTYPEQGPDAKSQTVDGRPSQLPYRHSVEGWCVQEAMKFIDSCRKQPWIMQVSLPRPHENYCPAKEFL